MIALAADCILLRRENGEAEPVNSGTVSIEVVTEGQSPFDEEFVKEASAAVLHYFKNEEGRDSVTLGEFAATLEKVLKGFDHKQAEDGDNSQSHIVETDLQKLAVASGEAFELTFFPRLRDELRRKLQLSPQVLRFCGLRRCVLRLTGARRWTPQCRNLQDQIVDFLRECLNAELHSDKCALVVE
jgi:hypothetical protein